MGMAALCSYDWCMAPNCKGNDHWYMAYTSATHPSHHRHGLQVTVGVGIVWDGPADDDDLPVVVVHVFGREGDVDADAHMRLAEAVELQKLLEKAVKIAGSVQP